MAIFDPARQGVTQGTNAMFANINQAMQRLQEQRQMQRNDEFLSSLKGQGLLGISSEEVIDPTTGKVNLGSGAQSVKKHFEQLGGSKNMKELRKVFGPTATADDVKSFIKQQSQKRDQAILSAIGLKMQEMGTDNIWKVVNKEDQNFKNWYNTADENVKLQLLESGYHPDIKERFGMPTFMERRMAQGKSPVSTVEALGTAGAGLLGYRFRKPLSGLMGLGKKSNISAPKSAQKSLPKFTKGTIGRMMEAGDITASEAKNLAKGLNKDGSPISKKNIPKSKKGILSFIKKAVGPKIAKKIATRGAISAIPLPGGRVVSGISMALLLPEIIGALYNNEE